MFCPKCGKEIPDDSSFCGNCGAKLADKPVLADDTKVDSVDQTNAKEDTADLTNASVSESTEGAEADSANISNVEAKSSDSETKTKSTPAVAKAVPVAATASGSGTATAVATPVKANNLKLPIIIGAAVVVVVVAAIIIYNIFFAPYDIDEKRFPDLGERNSISAQVDVDKDGKISRDEAKAVEVLEISDATSISGLEIFPNLKELYAWGLSGNDLVSADVDGCSALEMLTFAGNANLSDIKLGKVNSLNYAQLPGCAISTIDVSGAPALENLDLQSNPLVELDIKSNSKLTNLNVEETDLATLDLSGNPELTTLECDNSVMLENLDATPLHEYWVMSSFKDNGRSNGSKRYNSNAEATYDDNGNLSELVVTGSNSADAGTYEFEYDDNDRMTKVTETPSSRYSNKSTITLSYDDADRLTSVVSKMLYSGYTYTNNYTVTYDANGLPTHAEAIVDQGGAVLHDFKYDEAGNLSSVREYGVMDVTYAVVNDDQGRFIKMTPTASDSTYSAGAYEIAYDELGNITTANYTNPNGTGNGSYTSTITFDSLGRATNGTRQVRNDGSAKYIEANITSCEFTYNEHNLLTKIAPKYGSSPSDDDYFEIEYERLLLTRDTTPSFNFVDLSNILQPELRVNFYNPVYYLYQEDLAYEKSMKNVLELASTVKNS